MSSLIVPANTKYKTLLALSGRIDKIDSRQVKKALTKSSLVDKDLRKRSLNFHYFTTTFPTNTEVAIGIQGDQIEERKLRGSELRSLIHLFNRTDSPEYNRLIKNPNLIVETVSNHFREIPPRMYPAFANVLSQGDHSRKHNSYRQHVVRKLLSEFLRHIHDTDYSVFDLSNMLGCCRKYNIPITLVAYTRLRDLLLASKSACMALHGYFIQIPSGALNDAEFRLLRVLIGELTSELSSRRNKRTNLQTDFLGRLGLTTEHVDHPVISSDKLVEAVNTLGRFLTPSQRLPRRLYDDLCWFITSDPNLSHVQRITTLALFGRDYGVSRACRGLIHEYLKTNKNLASLPRKDLATVHQCAEIVGYHNLFQMRRLQNVLGVDASSLSHPRGLLKDHQVCVDERFRRVQSLLRYHHVRKARRRMHGLMKSINIGRVSQELVLGSRICRDRTCTTCESFHSQLELAIKFHEP